jgi:hypothetical protein
MLHRLTADSQNGTSKEELIMNNIAEEFQELCRLDLRGRLELMARVGHVYLRAGKGPIFICAVMKGEDVWFFKEESIDLFTAEILKTQILDFAWTMRADCIISVFQVSGGHAGPNVSDSDDREQLAAIGKDHFEHLGATQEIYRSNGDVTFGDLEFENVKSWIDEYTFLDQAAACC